MSFLGNIITSENFTGGTLYNITDNNVGIDTNVPTLIVGWEKAKELYPSEANILDWHIKDNIYWTFGKRIRRNKNEEDIIKFKKIVFEQMINSVQYEFFNMLIRDKSDKKKLFDLITNISKKYVFFDEDMVYLYIEDNNQIIGISLIDIDYEGQDRKKFLNLLYKTPTVEIVRNYNFISYEIKEIIRNKRYILPYLLSIAKTLKYDTNN